MGKPSISSDAYYPRTGGWWQPLRSKARTRKRVLMAIHGITSGRQWRKLRKRLRRESV